MDSVVSVSQLYRSVHLLLFCCSIIYGLSLCIPFYILCLSSIHYFYSLVHESIFDVLRAILLLCTFIDCYSTSTFSTYRFALCWLVLLCLTYNILSWFVVYISFFPLLIHVALPLPLPLYVINPCTFGLFSCGGSASSAVASGTLFFSKLNLF